MSIKIMSVFLLVANPGHVIPLKCVVLDYSLICVDLNNFTNHILKVDVITGLLCVFDVKHFIYSD
jgi:hypothetical protein